VLEVESPHASLPGLDSLASTVEWLTGQVAIDRIKITGGEPLVRARLVGLIERLAELDGITEVSLTTNGSLLGRLAGDLKAAGLGRVNVSLDCLDPIRFQLLTGGHLHETLQGIDAALAVGLLPVKINSVLHRSYWEEDVSRLLDFASERGLGIRFIELMPIGLSGSWAREEFIPASTVRMALGISHRLTALPHKAGVPARNSRMEWRGSTIEVGWITPESEPFCEGCNRLRLDAHGNLRRCLMDTRSLALLNILEQSSHDEPGRIVTEYLSGKMAPTEMSASHSMLMVGG
jgi:cyclic pyranopterin phosphate synthase